MNTVVPEKIDLTPPVTSEETLKRLREERRTQRMLRDLADGKWRRIILDAAQMKYPVVKNHAGRIETLLVKLNVIGPAMEMHADVLAGEKSSVTSPEGYDRQQEAINAVKERCLWDTRLHQACELVNREGAAYMRAGIDAVHRDVTIEVEDNEVCFPVGRLGPDQQPTAYERRWVIELEDPSDKRRTIKVLRIESHWLPTGSPVAAVAQRAYRVESSDPLGSWVGGKDVKPYDLNAVAPGVEETTMLPTRDLDIVQLVIGRRPVGGSGAAPVRVRIDEHDLDVLDAASAGASQIMRVMARHAEPRLRVTEQMLDKKTGGLDADQTVLVDPDKKAEYIRFEGQFEAMLTVLDKWVDHLLMLLRIGRGIMGMSSRDGAAPSTYGELRLNAQTTLTAARGSAAYLTPALERVWNTVSAMASAMPGGGFDIAPVSVRMSVGLYQGFADRVDEQRAALEAGLTSRWRAVAAVHGDENADAIVEEINADEDRRSDLAAKSLMFDVGGGRSGAGAGGDAGVVPVTAGDASDPLNQEGASP